VVEVFKAAASFSGFFTADQLDQLEAAQQHDLDQFERRSAAGGIRTP
jgi:hypothetical protein